MGLFELTLDFQTNYKKDEINYIKIAFVTIFNFILRFEVLRISLGFICKEVYLTEQNRI